MTASKIVAAAASSAGGDPVDIDDVFSTFLYAGNALSAQTITNGIDLSGEGGLVWIKRRTSDDGNSMDHVLIDSERRNGTSTELDYYLRSNTNDVEIEANDAFIGTGNFNNNGFVVGYGNHVNKNNQDYASWTFRKAPKFFDIVTYTGNATAGTTISHNLGSVPGMILVKNYSGATGHWRVYHRKINGGTNPEQYSMRLNQTTGDNGDGGSWNNTAPTATQFTLGNGSTNESGRNYVAYIFAHNNNDGEFGPDADQDIIKCGQFTDSGSSSTPSDVNLGFEPQFILFKRRDGDSDWYLMDVMREMSLNDARHLRANDNGAETNFSSGYFKPTPTGFQFRGDLFGTDKHIVYMAIRRGPLAVPEDATKVFHVNTYAGNTNSNEYNTGFDVDMNINTKTGSSTTYLMSRLTNAYLSPTDNTAENGGPATVFNSKSNVIDLNTAWWGGTTDVISYSWKRAPSYFDIVCWDGNGSARTIAHNLDTAAEMMWVKRRSSTEDWTVYHRDTGVNAYYQINSTGTGGTSSTAGGGAANIWNGTAPTASVFSIGTHDRVNTNGQTYQAFLFATAPGVSKVGYYTGSSGTVDVDCGFTNGAKYILIKLISHSGYGWYVFNSVRGIVSGNDPHLRLNEASGSEVTNTDAIDPLSSGFQVTVPANAGTGINANGYVYIFYAVAA